MKESFGNIWDLAQPYDAIVITTNGYVNKRGEAVMGKGIAYQAKQREPDVAPYLGRLLKDYGNHVHLLGLSKDNHWWFSFPVKHAWYERADIKLIEESAKDLVDTIDDSFINNPEDRPETIYLPRPGCGNGRLKWEDVKPVIEPYLDNRFVVVTL